MASLIAFPPKPAVNPNGADLNAAPEEDRHRDRVNLFAAVAVVLLIAAGLWIVNSLVETEKVQGCYASGTRYCSLI